MCHASGTHTAHQVRTHFNIQRVGSPLFTIQRQHGALSCCRPICHTNLIAKGRRLVRIHRTIALEYHWQRP